MANFKYFADTATGTKEFKQVSHNYKGFKLAAWDAEVSQWIGCTRAIEYKSFPSKHKCDARCTNAKGFKCECECGGKNHGAGNFACVED